VTSIPAGATREAASTTSGADETHEVPVDHPDLTRGWWAIERDGQMMSRWTDGEAVVPPPAMNGLEIYLAGSMTYAVDAAPEAGPARLAAALRLAQRRRAGKTALRLRLAQHRTLLTAPSRLAARHVPPHAPGMFVVTEADAAAIRAAFAQRGEFAAAVELRRRFPGITDNAQARECARTIAGWKPLPLRPVQPLPKPPRLRRLR
jgi:hypothetical protein